MAEILLHGVLHVTILEADSPPQRFVASSAPPGILRKAQTSSARSNRGPLSWIKRVSFYRPKTEGGEIYGTVDLEKARVGRTRMVNDRANPRWHESFHIYCAHMASSVIFTVKSNNPIGATLIGRAYLPVTTILPGLEVERWLELCDEDRRPLPGGKKIHVKLRYLHVSRDPNWGKGIFYITPHYQGVPYTYFVQREGCKVTLYQDAHVLNSFSPRIPLANGRYYQPSRCWEEMFEAISNARHLIYIAGWSVYAKVSLLRDPERARPRSRSRSRSRNDNVIILGELLKKKASEGVRVLMLVWDDRTSVGQFKKDGLMATHDEDTAEFFAGTEVSCVLCPRDPDGGGSIVQDLEISTMFTHHQKIVVVDSELPEGRRRRREGSRWRKVVGFVGGIDLCDGRYDTQVHSLFRTLDGAHANDFHQPNFSGASLERGGPREPWHDVHCKLEGPIAWDVLYNFEQRWRKQGGSGDLLLQLKRDLSATIIPPSPVMFPEDGETWNVQLFRSIDGGAAFGFPKKPEDAAKVGLVSGKDQVIDRSIQDAYINAIRRAKNFIYIENQYFLGSSFAWKPGEDIRVEDIGALHLIPKELSLKVVSKIEAGERFSVYVVIPMWPEGLPESASVQAILDWQRRTMEMMYMDITLALRARGLEGVDPKDYLSFLCLGNREVMRGREYTPTVTEALDADSDYARAQSSRRFMIYVHSKMMIVDDEYIIVGSANINQRSMDGARDTEIAVGAYQPYHLNTITQQARGQVHGFRMSLWYEHLKVLDDSFLQAESLECIRKVNKIAERNWDLYAREELNQDLLGHLLSYPVKVVYDGTVTNLRGSPFFPDTNARVLGTKSDLLPPILTT